MPRPLERSKRRKRVTYRRLRQLLSYDKDTGIWRWKALSHRRSNVPIGALAGTVSENGLRIAIDGVTYQAARLAFLYVLRRHPRKGCVIDRIDRNPLNLSWSNLREVRCDKANSAPNRSRVGMLKGAYLIEGQYRAAITVNGATRYIGTFETAAEANEAYFAAAKAAFGDLACDGKPPPISPTP